MKQEPKISIVIPVYNVKRYLPQCLDSLLAQTFSDFELICVDDGSSDGSLEILQEYQAKDPRIQILNQTNQGAAIARNKGIKFASGEYLFILDSDDHFHLELLEKCYHKAKKTGAEIVLYDAQYFDNETGENIPINYTLAPELFPNKEVFSAKETASTLYQATQSSAWKQMFKTSFIKENHLCFQSMQMMNDSFFTYAALSISQKITVIDEILLFYRFNNQSSIVSNPDKEPLAPIKFALVLKEFLEERGLFSSFQRTFSDKFIELSMWHSSRLNQYRSLEQFYQYLHQSQFKPFDLILDVEKGLPEAKFGWAKMVKELSFAEYLDTVHPMKAMQKIAHFPYDFPTQKVKKNENIILYGAGKMGKTYYTQNTLFQYCNIVVWVDKNYENLGFPVTGLESFSSVFFDKVLIAIENSEIVNVVTEQLVQIGISHEKIIS